MKIIPVIDLKGGQVVRGIAGRRDEYRPIQSQLVQSCDPAAVAAAFAGLGLREIYVADLDAITGAGPDFTSYWAITQQGPELLIDAGAGSRERAETLLAGTDGKCRIIVGLESLPNLSALVEIVGSLGPTQLIFSLDLMAGEPKTSSPELRELAPLEIAALAWEFGLREIIVLDVAQVGTDSGPSTTELCQKIRRRLGPELRLISGGGIRGLDDLQALAQCGCDAALVASALHDGRITRGDLVP